MKKPPEVEEHEGLGHRLVSHERSRNPDFAWERWTFEVSVRSTPEKVLARLETVQVERDAVRTFKHTEKRQRFLCVGGSHAGERLTESEAGIAYTCYNRAGYGDRESPKVILVAL